MKVSNQTAAQIGEVLNEIAKKFAVGSEDLIMTDLSFQTKQDSGELVVLDDNDDEVSSTTIDEWIDYQNDDFFDVVSDSIKQCIQGRKDELSALSIIKPYSFVLVDKHNETLKELYLVDDDVVIMETEELMKGLDKDLDEFIANLMKE